MWAENRGCASLGCALLAFAWLRVAWLRVAKLHRSVARRSAMRRGAARRSAAHPRRVGLAPLRRLAPFWCLPGGTALLGTPSLLGGEPPAM